MRPERPDGERFCVRRSWRECVRLPACFGKEVYTRRSKGDDKGGWC
jgi:hypothetical protein